jgi:hypothetical protein
MATVTPNFNFPVPQSTDLVKDGATAIAALGTSVDTQFVDLKGGTTGQVLSKASNTDLDYSWVTTDDANAIQNAIVDAKGDLIAATAADTPARLAVGANGTLLVADSTAGTGLAWGAAWTTYTPTINAGFTLGNGTQVFRYVKIGKTVFVQGTILWGSTTSMTAFDFTLPSTSATTQYGTNAIIGEFSAQDAGTASYHGFIRWLNSTSVVPRTIAASLVSGAITGASLNATTPFTWTTNDVMNFNFVYEEA